MFYFYGLIFPICQARNPVRLVIESRGFALDLVFLALNHKGIAPFLACLISCFGNAAEAQVITKPRPKENRAG